MILYIHPFVVEEGAEREREREEEKRGEWLVVSSVEKMRKREIIILIS